MHSDSWSSDSTCNCHESSESVALAYMTAGHAGGENEVTIHLLTGMLEVVAHEEKCAVLRLIV